MTLAALPTRTVGSLGLRKVDARPAADESTTLGARTWNRACDRIVELARVVGDVDASPSSSVEDAVRALNAPAAERDRWAFVADLESMPSALQLTTGSGGTAAVLDAEEMSSGDGLGVVKLTATTPSDTAGLVGSSRWVRGSHGATFRASVNWNLGGQLNCGLYDNVGFQSYAFLDTQAGPVWRALSASASGAGVGFETTAVAVTAGWHDIRIEITAGVSVGFYVDDVLISTLDGAGDVPDATDAMAVYILANYAASGSEVLVRHVEVTGDR